MGNNGKQPQVFIEPHHLPILSLHQTNYSPVTGHNDACLCERIPHSLSQVLGGYEGAEVTLEGGGVELEEDIVLYDRVA